MFYFNYLLECIAFIISLVFFRRIRPFAYRAIVFVLLLTVINEGFSYFGVYKYLKIRTTYCYNIFFIIELIAFFYIFFQSYSEKGYRYTTLAIFLIAIALSGYFLSRAGLDSFDVAFLNVVASSLILFGFTYLVFVYNKTGVYSLKSDPLFWFSTGVIMVNFFLLLFVNATLIEAFVKDPNSVVIFKTLNTLGNVFYYGCIIISMLCLLRLPNRGGT